MRLCAQRRGRAGGRSPITQRNNRCRTCGRDRRVSSIVATTVFSANQPARTKYNFSMGFLLAPHRGGRASILFFEKSRPLPRGLVAEDREGGNGERQLDQGRADGYEPNFAFCLLVHTFPTVESRPRSMLGTAPASGTRRN